MIRLKRNFILCGIAILLSVAFLLPCQAHAANGSAGSSIVEADELDDTDVADNIEDSVAGDESQEVDALPIDEESEDSSNVDDGEETATLTIVVTHVQDDFKKSMESIPYMVCKFYDYTIDGISYLDYEPDIIDEGYLYESANYTTKVTLTQGETYYVVLGTYTRQGTSYHGETLYDVFTMDYSALTVDWIFGDDNYLSENAIYLTNPDTAFDASRQNMQDILGIESDEEEQSTGEGVQIYDDDDDDNGNNAQVKSGSVMQLQKAFIWVVIIVIILGVFIFISVWITHRGQDGD